MKLILLHAAHLKMDRVAWTLGRHQTERFNGFGGTGLARLYDTTLRQVCERILARFQIRCETFEVYLPTNFSVYPSEGGYEVFDDEGTLIGTCASPEEAAGMLPETGREDLEPVHAVRLMPHVREALLQRGLPAWGVGL